MFVGPSAEYHYCRTRGVTVVVVVSNNNKSDRRGVRDIIAVAIYAESSVSLAVHNGPLMIPPVRPVLATAFNDCTRRAHTPAPGPFLYFYYVSSPSRSRPSPKTLYPAIFRSAARRHYIVVNTLITIKLSSSYYYDPGEVPRLGVTARSRRLRGVVFLSTAMVLFIIISE